MDGDREHFLLLKINDLREQGDRLDAENLKLRAENRVLRRELARAHRQIEELKAARQPPPPEDRRRRPPPPWVKPDVTGRRRKRPGRKAGHPAALRPPPAKVDQRMDVPLPRDGAGRESCPRCHACLLELRGHDRAVEDLAEPRVVVKVYHTRSGWCPSCRKRVESRAAEQPPAANVPHGQLGINALATGGDAAGRVPPAVPPDRPAAGRTCRGCGQRRRDRPARCSGWPGGSMTSSTGCSCRSAASPARARRRDGLADGWQERPALGLHHAPPTRVYHVDESRAGR
jgi:hypothetical protein